MTLDELWFDPSEMLISGIWRHSPARLTVEDPSTGEEVAEIARGGPAEIDEAVAAAEESRSGDWGRMTAAERGRIL